MRAEVVSLLRCPHCGGEFAVSSASLECARGHSFDIAGQGYVNLLPGDARPGTADTAAMVAAREAFLGAGRFAGLAQTVAATAARVISTRAVPADDEQVPPARRDDAVRGCVIDVGAGTGYYLAAVLEQFPDRVGLALDLSKFAMRRAAKAHGRIGAVVCDTWSQLPVRDRCAAVLLDIFAPRNASEFRRVLEPEGRLIVVTPTQRHLHELVSALGLVSVDTHKQERLDEKFASDFALVELAVHEERLTLAAHEIAALVGMGPSSRHLEANEVDRRIARLIETDSVTLSVLISVYRAR